MSAFKSQAWTENPAQPLSSFRTWTSELCLLISCFVKVSGKTQLPNSLSLSSSHRTSSILHLQSFQQLPPIEIGWCQMASVSSPVKWVEAGPEPVADIIQCKSACTQEVLNKHGKEFYKHCRRETWSTDVCCYWRRH